MKVPMRFWYLLDTLTRPAAFIRNLFIFCPIEGWYGVLLAWANSGEPSLRTLKKEGMEFDETA